MADEYRGEASQEALAPGRSADRAEASASPDPPPASEPSADALRKRADALRAAVTAGDEAALRDLIAAGANVNERFTAAGLTPLHLSAVHEHAGAARLLLAAGADHLARTQDEHSLTALEIASEGRNPVLDVLREAGCAESAPSSGFKEGDLACPGESPQVLVHVYDLWGTTRRWTRVLNKGTTRFGLFHTGVEVYGREWYFCSTPEGVFHGVYCMPEAKQHPMHRYSFTVDMGPTQLTRQDLEELIPQIREKWPGCSYHVLKRNCHSFVDFFCKVLGFPSGPKFGLCGSGDRQLAARLVRELRVAQRSGDGTESPEMTGCARCLSLGRRRWPAGQAFLEEEDDRA